VKTFNPLHTLSAKLWTAVTCHRFVRLADLSAKQRRVQRRGELPQPVVHSESVRPATFDGDKSPAQSAAKSAHSTAPGARTAMSARMAETKLADKAVRAPAASLSTVLMHTRVFVEAVLELLHIIATLTDSSRPWRRYRVTPRSNPAAFRHELRRGIQLELRRADLVNSRHIAGRTTI
jgi:hypothetical protein